MKTNRIPFTLKDYESGKYKVVTRDGRSARVVCTDCVGTHPIIALVRKDITCEDANSYHSNGTFVETHNSSYDLFLEKQELEDGDIVSFGYTSIGILKEIFSESHHSDYITLTEGALDDMLDGWTNNNMRLATDLEKEKLFDTLAKDGKRWNAEKKCIEDIKEECELKPFQKVLVRYTDNDAWKANMFSHFIDGTNYKYICIDSSYKQCIPYEGNEKLLGTINKKK